MPNITLDGVPWVAGGDDADTWGGLLTTIDEALTGARRIVTDVRFDGIDEPAFRDPLVVGRSLEELAAVEVVSGTPAMLVERILGEAAASLDGLCLGAAHVADLARAHESQQAARGLLELAEGLSALVGIAGAAALALQVDLNELRCHDRPATALVGELTRLIDQLIAAQGGGDWITVADVLQYDVEPTLRAWRPLFSSLLAAPAA
jgi:hypothetical protein